jgi:hypothetical protein
MSLRIDGTRVVRGGLTVRFTPDLPTDRLVFRLWPNGPRLARAGARLSTGSVAGPTGQLRSFEPDPTTLVVLLDERLQAGDSITVSLPWRLALPGAVLDRLSLNGDSYRLGSFFPLLAWVPGSGWALHPPTTSLAETSISPAADFRVDISVPEGFDVLATGVRSPDGVWRARAVRDFAVAAGRFEVVTGKAQATKGVAITVGVEESLEGSPAEWRDQVINDLEELARRYGPYPWSSYTLAISPDLLSAGIEYPTMVFQGEDTLGQTTSHELGHMWFYSLVGSNPARHPWLDEGVNSWAEARVMDTVSRFASLTIPSDVRGRLGRPMTYWDQHQDEYYFGVYAQGVQALDALGRDRLVDCALRSYVAQNAYKIATPSDLLDDLESYFPQAERVLGGFGVRF